MYIFSGDDETATSSVNSMKIAFDNEYPVTMCTLCVLCMCMHAYYVLQVHVSVVCVHAFV